MNNSFKNLVSSKGSIFIVMIETTLIDRLKEFMENEARTCSMDFGCVTPLYVYRSFGGTISMEDIENGLTEIQNQGFLGR